MISIRTLQDDDAEYIVKYNENTDENFLNQWGGGRFYTYPLTVEQIINRIKNKDNTRYFAILNDGLMIGAVELDFIDWDNKKCNVCRFLIEEKSRGHGYGTEALKLVTQYALDELHMKNVYLSVFDFNKNALRCYEKAGYKIISQEVRTNGWLAYKMEYIA
ncbi:MAG: hypothetical protein A2Y15_05130 [Clostridiales bacterium GWF2_36_10]|nr:MAG: hypothetical protein A2Y15_05130 [Clostridiales bacterium GWF2_36_10]HAN20238.1 N-acetyltransferase [Clostridiales bacterium]